MKITNETKKEFKPFKITFEIENENDARILFARFNAWFDDLKNTGKHKIVEVIADGKTRCLQLKK